MYFYLKYNSGCCYCLINSLLSFALTDKCERFFLRSYVGVQQTPTNASFKNGGRSLSVSKNNKEQIQFTKNICPKNTHVCIDQCNRYLPMFRIIKKPRLKSFHCFQQFLRHVYCWSLSTGSHCAPGRNRRETGQNRKVPQDLRKKLAISG